MQGRGCVLATSSVDAGHPALFHACATRGEKQRTHTRTKYARKTICEKENNVPTRTHTSNVRAILSRAHTKEITGKDDFSAVAPGGQDLGARGRVGHEDCGLDPKRLRRVRHTLCVVACASSGGGDEVRFWQLRFVVLKCLLQGALPESVMLPQLDIYSPTYKWSWRMGMVRATGA